jgi:site-specific DNA-cytosine methylase
MKTVICQGFAGGLLVGAEQAGADVVADLEFGGDAWNRGVLATIQDTRPSLDVREGSVGQGWDLDGLSGIDVVAGNPPCSAWSVRANLHKTRLARGQHPSMAWWETFAETASELGPAYTLLESVLPAWGHPDGQLALKYVRDVIDPGATIHIVKHSGHELGNAQIRRRLWAVITRQPYAPTWPDPASLEPADYEHAFRGLPDDPDPPDIARPNTHFFLRWREHGIVRSDIEHNQVGGGLWKQAPRIFQKYCDNGGDPDLFLGPRHVRALKAGQTLPRDGYCVHALDWDQPARVVLYDSSTHFMHPGHVRGLSLRECYRLMGFPDDWILPKWEGDPHPWPHSRHFSYPSKGVTVEAAKFAFAGIGSHSPAWAESEEADDNVVVWKRSDT